MSPNEPDGAAVRFPPPFVYLLAIVLGILLEYVVFPLPLPLSLGVRIAGAAVISLLGIALVAAAFGLFRRTGQDPAPWKSTPQIISTGIYRFTRNPMYLGMGLIQAGIGIGLASGWIVALLPIVLCLIYGIAIRHEEAYLERKFGAEYVGYKRSVRRWL